MNCPHDGAALVVARRTGVENDVCRICRGCSWTAGNWTKSLPSPAPAAAQASHRHCPAAREKLRPRGY